MSHSNMYSVSIIIPAWNEAKTLRATLKALTYMDYDKQKCEVIVVAGGYDNTYRIAKELSRGMQIFLRYVVLTQIAEGKNAAIQRGISEAKHDIIALLDADTIVTKEWLRNMVGPIECQNADLTIANPYPVKKTWVSEYYMVVKTYLLDRIVNFSGHAIALKTSIVRNRLDHFFHIDTKVGVDYLLTKRFLEEGYRVMFAKDAHVKTHLPSSLRYFVMCELRWLTALISIDGINFRSLAGNIAVVSALLLAIPISKPSFALSLLLNSVYVTKRVRMFLRASKMYDTNMRDIFGFVVLSYGYHFIGLMCYVKHFLGVSGKPYLYQGQRH